MVLPDRGIQIARMYYCRGYREVYGIETAKSGRWIGFSSVWTLQTDVLNGRAIVSLEFMNWPDGKCRSI